MNLKRFFSVAFMTAIMSVNTFAAGINVYVNDELVTFPDAQAKIINDRTMVPVRGLFERLGFDVEWDSVNKMATLRSKYIVISANEQVLIANKPGGPLLKIDDSTMPVISEGRLYLPLRVIAQATGCLVNWDSDTKSVKIAIPEINTGDDQEDGYISDEGNMSPDEQEYLNAVFAYLDDIKQEMIISRDPSLMLFYNVDRSTEANYATIDYTNIINNANAMIELTAPKDLADVDVNVKAFSNLIIRACNAASNKESSVENITSQITGMQQTREGISLDFSMNLVKFFNDKNVSYERLFTEYCLDSMNQ